MMKEKMNFNRRSLKKALGIVLSAAVLVCMAAVTGGTVISAKTGNTAKVVSAGTYKNKSGKYEASIKTPKVTGKVKGAAVLNKKMKAYTDGIKAAYLKDKKAVPKGFQTVITNYQVKANNSKVLSIQINTNIIMADSNSFSRYFNLDKKTGKVVQLKDLFKKNADYISVLSKNINSQIKKLKNSADYDFTKIGKNQSFYINKKGNLVITFNKFDIAPGSYGEQEFIIPANITNKIVLKNSVIS